MVLLTRNLIRKKVRSMSSLFLTGNVLKTCKIEVSCYRLNAKDINLPNHLHQFVPSGHQNQILSKRFLNHQAPSPSSQQQ